MINIECVDEWDYMALLAEPNFGDSIDFLALHKKIHDESVHRQLYKMILFNTCGHSKKTNNQLSSLEVD